MSAKLSSDPVGFLNVVPLLGHIALAAITQALTYPFRTVRCTALYNDVLYAAVRCMLERITIPQSRYLNLSTSEQYLAYCKRQNTEPKTTEVGSSDDKVAAHWLGDPNAKTVILYLHGGGYTQAANTGNFQYMSRLVTDLNSAKGCSSVAVLILAYTLAPEAVYPTQLREAAAALAHLINETGRSPSDIFITGDSAGGNLALSLLSHVLHPHPDVSAINLPQPLGGALLYSPWTGFSTTYSSFDNVRLDVLAPLALRKWSAMFLNKANSTDPEADPGPVSGDAWTEACLNPASWWNGLHAVVGDVFVCYGSYEVLAGPIKELEQQLKKGWAEGGGEASRIVFLETAKEVHIQPIIDISTLGVEHKSSTQVAVEEWYKARLYR